MQLGPDRFPEQTVELADQAETTPARSFDALLWQLDILRDYVESESERRLATIIAGVEQLAGPDFRNKLEELIRGEREPQSDDEARAELIEPLKRKATCVYEAAITPPRPECDPVVTWIAARRDINNVWKESYVDGELDDNLGNHADDLIKKLDDRFGGTVATTPAGLIGQVRLLAERYDGKADGRWIADNLVATLTASINAGIERFGRPVG